MNTESCVRQVHMLAVVSSTRWYNWGKKEITVEAMEWWDWWMYNSQPQSTRKEKRCSVAELREFWFDKVSFHYIVGEDVIITVTTASFRKKGKIHKPRGSHSLWQTIMILSRTALKFYQIFKAGFSVLVCWLRGKYWVVVEEVEISQLAWNRRMTIWEEDSLCEFKFGHFGTIKQI